MNILFITTQFPFPLDNGGKIGAFNGISSLDYNNNITVLSFCEEMDSLKPMSVYEQQFKSVRFVEPIQHDVHIQKKYFTLVRVVLKSIFQRIPYICTKFQDKNMFRLIDAELAQNDYDLIFTDYLNMAIYSEYIQKKYADRNFRYILKDHNIEYELFEQAAESASGIKRKILEMQTKITKQYEISQIKNNEMTFSVCDDNVNFLKEYNEKSYPMKPTFVINELIDAVPEANRLLFIGNLTWKQNMEGLKWFFDNVWKLILDKKPDTIITIAGSGLKENPFEDIPNVDYRGYVENLEDVYRISKVFIVPLLEGSGIRIKILDAFNNSIAVVSTCVGCDTIGAEDGKELFKADNPQEFAEKVIKLLDNDDLIKSLKHNALCFLKDNYSLDTRQKEVASIIGQ